MGAYGGVLLRGGKSREQLGDQLGPGCPNGADGEAVDLHGIVPGNKNGVGADSPVDQPVLMDQPQGLEHGQEQVRRLLPAEHGPPLVQVLPDGQAVDVLHHRVDGVVLASTMPWTWTTQDRVRIRESFRIISR